MLPLTNEATWSYDRSFVITSFEVLSNTLYYILLSSNSHVCTKDYLFKLSGLIDRAAAANSCFLYFSWSWTKFLLSKKYEVVAGCWLAYNFRSGFGLIFLMMLLDDAAANFPISVTLPNWDPSSRMLVPDTVLVAEAATPSLLEDAMELRRFSFRSWS